MRFHLVMGGLKGKRLKKIYECFSAGKFDKFLDQLLENLVVTTSHHQQVKNTDD